MWENETVQQKDPKTSLSLQINIIQIFMKALYCFFLSYCSFELLFYKLLTH